MEESVFESEQQMTSKLTPYSSSELSAPDAQPREAAYAIVVCLCLAAMIGLVAILVITSSNVGGGDSDDGGTTMTDASISVPSIVPGPVEVEIRVDTNRPRATTQWTTRRRIPTPAPILHTPFAKTTPTTTPKTTPTTVPTLPTPLTTTSKPATTPTTTSTTTGVPALREIICTLGESAISEAMYPSDKYCDYLFYSDVVVRGTTLSGAISREGFLLFLRESVNYKYTQLGFSFNFQETTTKDLDNIAYFLAGFRYRGVRHFGLLTVLAFPSNFSIAVASTKPMLQKLKEIQDGDPGGKTVIAIGSYDFSGSFINTFASTFTDVVNNYKADIVIAITSTGWIGYPGFCNAAPPTALTSKVARYPSLLSHWFVVAPQTAYTNPLAQVGLSFDLSTLQYALINSTSSVEESLLLPCESVRRASRDALCVKVNGKFAAKYLGNEAYAYGVLSLGSKVLTMGDYSDTVAAKFNKAVKDFGGIRPRTAWLFYNIQDDDVNYRCPEQPQMAVQVFCKALKGANHRLCD